LSIEPYIMQRYNAAIAHLRTATQDLPTQTTIRLNLVCCLLFIFLENLRGNYAESTRHIKAGSTLLISALGSEGLASQGVVHPGMGDMDELHAMKTMFSRFGADVSSLNNEDLVSHRKPFGPSLPLIFFHKDPAVGPFPDLSTAEW
jgi:hypothetical protein